MIVDLCVMVWFRFVIVCVCLFYLSGLRSGFVVMVCLWNFVCLYRCLGWLGVLFAFSFGFGLVRIMWFDFADFWFICMFDRGWCELCFV